MRRLGTCKPDCQRRAPAFRVVCRRAEQRPTADEYRAFTTPYPLRFAVLRQPPAFSAEGEARPGNLWRSLAPPVPSLTASFMSGTVPAWTPSARERAGCRLRNRSTFRRRGARTLGAPRSAGERRATTPFACGGGELRRALDPKGSAQPQPRQAPRVERRPPTSAIDAKPEHTRARSVSPPAPSLRSMAVGPSGPRAASSIPWFRAHRPCRRSEHAHGCAEARIDRRRAPFVAQPALAPPGVDAACAGRAETVPGSPRERQSRRLGPGAFQSRDTRTREFERARSLAGSRLTHFSPAARTALDGASPRADGCEHRPG